MTLFIVIADIMNNEKNLIRTFVHSKNVLTNVV